MTPDELAARHPRLFHVTLPRAWPSIQQHGLLSTAQLLALAGRAHDPIGHTRRPAAVALSSTITLNDQSPLSDRALAGCLDDGLSPAEWIALLNRRVFFWSSAAGLTRLLHARANRDRPVTVLEFDTLALARAYASQIEICPINSGSTIRKPARRGRSTFTPLGALPYAAWSRQRGGRDAIVEVTVLDGVPDASAFVRSHHTCLGGAGAAFLKL